MRNTELINSSYNSNRNAMTRASWSIGSSTVNSKAVWLSKLVCRRDEMFDVNEIEKHIVPLLDSVELDFPIPNNGKEMGNEKKEFYNRRKYSHVPSFPNCSIGCNRNDDETVCSNLDPKIIFSKDWTIHTDQDTVAYFNNRQSSNENDHSLDSNSEETAHQLDNTQMRTVNREMLSPTLQLLHEVYMKKFPSNTGVYFLSSNRHNPSRNDIHSNLSAIENKEDKNAIDAEHNTCDSVQMERMIFRQQLRYEAIRKELFDSVEPLPINKNSVIGNSAADMRRQEFIETGSLMDTAGCHAISFWNYIPSVSNLLLNVLPEGDALDDDSADEGDLDEISSSDGQSYFSYGTCTNSGSTDNKYDYNHIPHTVNKKEFKYKNECDDNPSYSGSSVDPSHIYLKATNARLERATLKKRESNSTSGNTVVTKNISELTIGDFTINSRIRADNLENELYIKQHEHKFGVKDIKHTDFGWARHFQPFGEHQIDIDIRQNVWLNAIHDCFKEQNTGSLLPDAILDQKLRRRVAANEALQRIVQQGTKQGSLNNLSTIVFDLWR